MVGITSAGSLSAAKATKADLWGISYPTWAEDPTPAIKMLKDYATQSGGGPSEELASLAAERERTVAETHEPLHRSPRAARAARGPCGTSSSSSSRWPRRAPS